MFPIGTEPRQQQTTRLELLLDQRRSRKRECFTSVIHAHGHLPRCKLHYSIKAAAENVRCVCRLHTVPLPRCIFRKARSSWNGPPPMLPRIFSRRSCSFSAMVRSGTFSDAALTFACDASEQNRKRGAGNRPTTSPWGTCGFVQERVCRVVFMTDGYFCRASTARVRRRWVFGRP